MSGIRLLDCSKLTMNWKNDNNVTAHQHDVIVKLFDITLFFLSSLVTGPSFMSISSLVLELWKFSFIRDGPEIWKSEILLSEFCQIFGDWGELPSLRIPNAAKVQGYNFYLFWVIKGKPTGEGSKITPSPQIRVNKPINIFSIT